MGWMCCHGHCAGAAQVLLEGMEEAVPAGEPQRGQRCRQHCQEVSRQLHLKNMNRQGGRTDPTVKATRLKDRAWAGLLQGGRSKRIPLWLGS